ncbi:polyprenyl synthetase family protein [Wolbachia pipientis]|uniref:polyprenyl synthetase family protein n=1 Tax=Wolbachia pipientis TaxID=955 RepID=UPI0009BCE1EE|nr:polyprenyl synthetase family protein [Wolbachia pipientis]
MCGDLLAIEKFISNSLISINNQNVQDIIFHLIRSGGKKVRPKLVCIICKMLNYLEEDRIKVAASVELIHNATLLHDDVLDESDARHGIKTANNIWGNKLSILVGDLLLTIAFRWLITCQNLRIVSILFEASHSLVNGEIMQLTTNFNPDTVRQNYFDIIQKKTASLFSACCEAAAIISGATGNEVDRLKKFGLNFGMAFQIIDDMLDYIATQDTSGKKQGKDFFDGKPTLPAIIAYERGNKEEREFWNKCFTLNEHNLSQALNYIKKHDAIRFSIEEAKLYVNVAQSEISDFSNKDILIDFLYKVLHVKDLTF